MAPLPEDLQKLKWYGDFPVMERVIKKRLAGDLPQALRERLLAELEVISRLPGQYPYSWEEALGIMVKNIRDFSREEFQELWEDNAMDWIYIQGKVHFHTLFFQNLVKTREWLCSRLLFPELAGTRQENIAFLNRTIAAMKAGKGISRRFCVRTTLELKESARRPGERIKVYLPIPVEYAQVRDVRLLHARTEVDGSWRDVKIFHIPSENDGETHICRGKEDKGFAAWAAPAHAPQRTVCFVGEYQRESRFQIEYSYQVDMPYIDLYRQSEQETPAKQRLCGWFPQNAEDFPEHYLGEQLPHIHFTPYLRALAAEIVGKETKPLKKAQKIYDYLTTHVMYSFVREYFLIAELVDYTASGWKGDCGLQALLFITLCRIAGIPARWQSGLYIRPEDPGSHDWAMFYLEEYGWLFADCSFGGSAARMGCEERRRFYFGNLDPYRMPSCCQFQADFLPPVEGWRFDPYDNQSGEVEYPEGCLRPEEMETRHEVQETIMRP